MTTPTEETKQATPRPWHYLRDSQTTEWRILGTSNGLADHTMIDGLPHWRAVITEIFLTKILDIITLMSKLMKICRPAGGIRAAGSKPSGLRLRVKRRQPPGNFMAKPKYDVVRVQMDSEKVRVMERSLTRFLAETAAETLERKAGERKVFHDYVPAGSYRDGQLYEGNKR